MDAVFKALSDPTRRALLDTLLASPGLTLSELVAGTDMRRQSATKHLKLLEGAGLVHIEWQGREKRHFLNPVPIQDISRRWVDKFSQARSDALLTLKSALEADKDQTPEDTPMATASVELNDSLKQGPTITSFFTPIKD